MMVYRTIVVDPPWNYEAKLGDGPRGAGVHYPCMTVEKIGRVPIAEWASPDAHLYLWVTNTFMVEGHVLARHWGFQVRAILTWVKPGLGLGSYFRNSTEHVLFAVRGTLRLLRRDLPTHFCGPRRGHSQKPDGFYDIVESASPGPYLDVFARVHRFNWSTWGNECYCADELTLAEEARA